MKFVQSLFHVQRVVRTQSELDLVTTPNPRLYLPNQSKWKGDLQHCKSIPVLIICLPELASSKSYCHDLVHVHDIPLHIADSARLSLIRSHGSKHRQHLVHPPPSRRVPPTQLYPRVWIVHSNPLEYLKSGEDATQNGRDQLRLDDP